MNRAPFFHGLARFVHVNNKGNRRFKRVSLKRKIINAIFFALGIALLIFVFVKGLGQIFIFGAAFFLGICAIPLSMSTGKNMVLYEAYIAGNQKRANLPLDFNRKKAIIGYILMFAPLYILMLGCFFFPAHKAWVIPYIPLFMYTLISASLSAHTVEALELSMKKYKWIHILLYIGIFALGCFIRIFIMYPWLDN